MKRVIQCVSLVICFLCLGLFLSFPADCLDYSNSYPSYLKEKGNFFIEVGTVELGRGSIILANNYKVDNLSTYGNTSELYNTLSSTISGYFLTQNGTYYQLRFTTLDTAQYYLSGSGIGGNYGWQDLTVQNLYSTNGSILGDKGVKVHFFTDFEKLLVTMFIVICTVSFVIGGIKFIINLRKGSSF